MAEAAGGLVEQQQPRLRDERAGELDPLSRRVRKPGYRPFREPLELEVLEDLAQPRPRGAARVRSDEDVLGTVIDENSSTFWKVRAIPRRITPCGGVPSRLLPSNVTVPSSGLYSRVITLKAVVLPAPFGPISPAISPRSTESETSSSATTPPKRRVTCSSSSSAKAALGPALDEVEQPPEDAGAVRAQPVMLVLVRHPRAEAPMAPPVSSENWRGTYMSSA